MPGTPVWRSEWVKILVSRRCLARLLTRGLDMLSDPSTGLDTAAVHHGHQALRCCLRLMDAIMTIGSASIGTQLNVGAHHIAGRSGMYPSDPLDQIPPFPPLRHMLSNILHPHPYAYLVKIFALASAVTSIFVSKGSSARDVPLALEHTQKQLNDFHNNLPEELRFDTATFQTYTSLEQGGAFVLLHVCPRIRLVSTLTTAMVSYVSHMVCAYRHDPARCTDASD